MKTYTYSKEEIMEMNVADVYRKVYNCDEYEVADYAWAYLHAYAKISNDEKEVLDRKLHKAMHEGNVEALKELNEFIFML